MMVAGNFARHEEAWLMLPWLVSGRLSQAQRERIEEHVSQCAACAEEFALQRLICNALAEPDRVTYAPGPSFRKLMDRIDATATQKPRERGRDNRETNKPAALRSPTAHSGSRALWRPPGLAWAASFVLAIGIAGIVATAYQWSKPAYEPGGEPVYRTHTDPAHASPNVLHIVFDRSLKIGEVEELLRSDGARIVEGPGSTGIFGITPDAVASGEARGQIATREIQALSARLRADPRVRWVEPVAGSESSGAAQPPSH